MKRRILCLMLCVTMMCGPVIPAYAQEDEAETNVEVKFPWAPNTDSTNVLKTFSKVTRPYEPNISDIPEKEIVEEAEDVEKMEMRCFKCQTSLQPLNLAMNATTLRHARVITAVQAAGSEKK